MNDQVYRRFLIAIVVLMLAALLSGGLVTATESGAACPDWPICAEQLGENATLASWIAFGHRIVVLIGGFAVFLGAYIAWRRADRDLWVRLPPLLAPALMLAQSGFGAIMVRFALYDAVSVSHLAMGLLVLACQVVPLAALSMPNKLAEQHLGGRANKQARGLQRMAWWLVGAVGVLVLADGTRSAPCIGAPCTNLPAQSGFSAVQSNTGAALIVAGLLLTALLLNIWRSRRTDRVVLALVGLIFACFAAEAFLLNSTLPTSYSLVAGTLLWGSTLTLGMASLRRPLPVLAPAPVTAPKAERTPSLLSDYISLTKPKVIMLLLATTLAAMFITEAGMPAPWLVFWTLLGGYLAAGGAGALNCAFDEDIDINMGRTSRRPVPSGRISRRNAFRFGLALSLLSVAVMWFFTTPLATFFSTLGILYYAVFYTRWLKRSTWQNIVIGGGAGSLPPLVGWTAVTGNLSLAAVLLFVIIYYWTPPHFWALALVKEKDYARAGVPMLPVVAGEAETRWQIWLYSILLVALSLLLTPIGAMGWIYFGLALLLGAIFLKYAWDTWRRGDQQAIWGLYKYSLLYLALLFAAMVVDRMLAA
jgi:protoheme IX farnesyltransferase